MMNNFNEYTDGVLRTENKDFEGIKNRLQDDSIVRCLHGIIGMVTEVGEIADIFKRYIFYGKEIDWSHMNEEFGDSMYYNALLSDVIKNCEGSDLAESCRKNLAKLSARYPDKFSSENAINRNLEKENEAMK